MIDKYVWHTSMFQCEQEWRGMRERSNCGQSCGQRLSKSAITQQRMKQSSQMPCHASSTLVRDICSPHLSKAARGKARKKSARGISTQRSSPVRRLVQVWHLRIHPNLERLRFGVRQCADELEKEQHCPTSAGPGSPEGQATTVGPQEPKQPSECSSERTLYSSPCPSLPSSPPPYSSFRNPPAAKSPPEAAQVVGVRNAAESCCDEIHKQLDLQPFICQCVHSSRVVFKIWCGFECTSSSPLMAAMASSGTGKLRDNILKAYIWARSCTA